MFDVGLKPLFFILVCLQILTQMFYLVLQSDYFFISAFVQTGNFLQLGDIRLVVRFELNNCEVETVSLDVGLLNDLFLSTQKLSVFLFHFFY